MNHQLQSVCLTNRKMVSIHISVIFHNFFLGIMKLVKERQRSKCSERKSESSWIWAEVTGWVNGQCVSTPPTSWWPRWGLQLSWHMDRWPLAADLYSGRHWGTRHTKRWTLQRMREGTLRTILWHLSYMTFKQFSPLDIFKHCRVQREHSS